MWRTGNNKRASTLVGPQQVYMPPFFMNECFASSTKSMHSHTISLLLLSATPLLRIPTQSKPRGYWRDNEHRKQYFIEFAKAQGFDPFDSKRWAQVSPLDVHSSKVALQLSISLLFSLTLCLSQFSSLSPFTLLNLSSHKSLKHNRVQGY